MLDLAFAQTFAAEWIAAWNSHDLSRILRHYSADFEMSSPVIVQLMGEPSGKLVGQTAVGDYWAKALARLPDLHFELTTFYIGVDSLTLCYNGPRGQSAEVFHFNSQGLVVRAYAHYAPIV